MDKLVASTKDDIKVNINAMKKDTVGEIKQEVKESINTTVDDRNKELEDRARRYMSVVIFNLKDHINSRGT